jgi:hypothetical protein
VRRADGATPRLGGMGSKDWRPTAFAETAPGIVGEEEAEASRLEQRRSLLAFIRHLMTLDTVALVLTVALAEKAFAQPLKRGAVAVAVGAFLLSLAIGGVAHLARLANGPRVGDRHAPADDRNVLPAWSLATFVAFAAAVGALAWFFFANWNR